MRGSVIRSLFGPILAAAAGLASSACDGPAARDRLRSAYPPDRAGAIVQIERQRDVSAAHDLVSLLEDDDPAVRMYAIVALERLCGQTYGYRYYGPEIERRDAVLRWRAALRDGSLALGGRPNAGQAVTPPASDATPN